MEFIPSAQCGKLSSTCKMLVILIFLALTSGCLSDVCPNTCTCTDSDVDCYGRMLTYIPDNVPVTVRKLELQENRIQEVDGEFLATFQDLQELFLKKNLITKLGPQTFANLSYLHSIDLSNNQIQDIDPEAFFNLSSLESLDLSNNQLTDISGKLETVPSLQRLNLNTNKLTALKDDSFKNFPRLVYLSLSNNQIEFVSDEAFTPVKLISYLVLSSNPMKKVNNILRNSEALTFLDVSHCQLQQFPVGLPWTLRFLGLSNNKLMTVQSHDMEDIQHLNSIDLDNNQISYIQNGSFSKAPYLLVISLNGNRLTELSFQIPRTVLKFFAERNKIQRLFQNNFEVSSKMSVLSLYNNSISELDPYTFSPLTNLTSLNLGLNQIKTLRRLTFAGLRQLKYLNLERNPISSVEDRAFSSLVSVETLQLSSIGSNTTSMEEKVFLDLSSLMILNLQASPSVAKNLVQSPYMLRTLHGLTLLNLMDNNLTTLSADIRVSLFNLKQIQLSGNPWHCDHKLLELKHWIKDAANLFADKIICATPYNLQGRSVKEIDIKEFTPPPVFVFSSTRRPMIEENSTLPLTEASIPQAIPDKSLPMDEIERTTELYQLPASTGDYAQVFGPSLTTSSFHQEIDIDYKTLMPTPVTLTAFNLSPTLEITDTTAMALTETPAVPETSILTWLDRSQDTVVSQSLEQTSSMDSFYKMKSSDQVSIEPTKTLIMSPTTGLILLPTTVLTLLPTAAFIAPEHDYGDTQSPHSFNSRDREKRVDNRLPTFSNSASSRMQIIIIGVAVALLLLITVLLATVVMVHCRRKKRRLIINDPTQAMATSAQETTDTAFIIRHMEGGDVPGDDSDNRQVTTGNQRVTPGNKKSSTSSLASSASSRKSSSKGNQRVSTSSSSRASFDCIHGTKDDDSEMLMQSWN